MEDIVMRLVAVVEKVPLILIFIIACDVVFWLIALYLIAIQWNPRTIFFRHLLQFIGVLPEDSSDIFVKNRDRYKEDIPCNRHHDDKRP